MLIAVHHGNHHADDVTATAIHMILHPGQTITRTRDPMVITKADVVFDVGGEYDPERLRFDHHQKEGAGFRSSGLPYASAGLAWKHFGLSVIAKLEPELSETERTALHKQLDAAFFAHVDALDCGVNVPGPSLMGYSNIIDGFNPSWREPQDDQERYIAFKDAVDFAAIVITNHITRMADGIHAARRVREFHADNAAGIPEILLLERGMPWETVVINEMPCVQFVVFPDAVAGWRVKAVRKALHSYEPRRHLPASWAGLEGADLDRVAGVQNCVFCHRGRFIAGNRTREGILAMAHCALA